MADSPRDQAAGLRRLFRRAAPPLIAFVGGHAASGATRVACAFAQSLAARGLAVTLIDEHRGEHGAAALLNARGRFDLSQAINGDALISQTVVMAGERLRVLPAARLAQQRAALDDRQRGRLAQLWRGLGDSGDVVLIDAHVAAGGRLSPLAAKAGSLALVTGGGSAAVMGAYLSLKLLAQAQPAARLALVVNRVMDATQAAGIVDNLRDLARRQLGREIEAFAWLPSIAAWRGRDVPLSAAEVARLAALDALLPAQLRHDRCDHHDDGKPRGTPSAAAAGSPLSAV